MSAGPLLIITAHHDSIELLAQTLPSELLLQKMLICCVLNGFDPERYLEMHRFGSQDAPTEKPQYIHSATSIYLVLRNECMRQNNTFWNFIVEGGYEQAALVIAGHVLATDQEVFNWVSTVEQELRSIHFICDESGKTMMPS